MAFAEIMETGTESRLIEESVRSSLASFRQMLGGGPLDVEPQEFIHTSTRAHACLRQLRRNGVEVVLTLSGGLSGTFALVLSDVAARQLVTALVGKVPRAAILNDMERSALKELGNVVASAFLGALERLCGSGGVPGLPLLRLEDSDDENSEERTGLVLYGLPVNLVGSQKGCRIANAGIFIALNTNSV